MSSKRKASDLQIHSWIPGCYFSSSPLLRCDRSVLELCDLSKSKKLKRWDGEDRISSLPDVVLADILSLLPTTKDAVVTSALSRRWRRLFTLVTRLDFDGSLISHCSHFPTRADSFPTFKMFVDNVLEACQPQTHNLTSFRLHFGRGDWPRCRDHCFLTLEPLRLNAWLCYPLTRGVRKLDIFVRVKKPCKLSSSIFCCQTLEVLKLNMNLDLEVPSYLSLPNLKVLHLYVVYFPVDDTVSRLVSSCPSLEQLTLKGSLNPKSPALFSSPSLRSLVLIILDGFRTQKSKVVLDVPNLEYLHYLDFYGLDYSFCDLNRLVEAEVDNSFDDEPENILRLISPLSNVQRMFLMNECVEALSDCDIQPKLPVFGNLKHLQLGCFGFYYWNKVLMQLLTCAPFLETLIFPEGIVFDQEDPQYIEVVEIDRLSWRRTHLVPSCLGLYLKRVLIKEYELTDWELEIVSYFLKNSSVLEELDITCRTSVPLADKNLLEVALRKLTRGSATCSVNVQ